MIAIDSGAGLLLGILFYGTIAAVVVTVVRAVLVQRRSGRPWRDFAWIIAVAVVVAGVLLLALLR